MAAGDRQSAEVLKLSIKQPPMNKMAVEERHEKFCQEYVRDFNGVRAIIEAGYSPDRAGNTFCDLRKRPEIAARIRELVEERKRNHEIDITLVLDELYSLAMTNTGALPRDSDGNIQLDALTPDQQRSISSIKQTEKFDPTTGKSTTTVEIKTHDKLQAIIHYLKLNGMGIDLPPAIPPDAESDDDQDIIEFVEPKKLKE